MSFPDLFVFLFAIKLSKKLLLLQLINRQVIYLWIFIGTWNIFFFSFEAILHSILKITRHGHGKPGAREPKRIGPIHRTDPFFFILFFFLCLFSQFPRKFCSLQGFSALIFCFLLLRNENNKKKANLPQCFDNEKNLISLGNLLNQKFN